MDPDKSLEYSFTVKDLLDLKEHEFQIKPLTILIGNDDFTKNVLLRLFWLLLKITNPVYVALFSKGKARDEEDYVSSAEYMIKDISKELFNIPLYKLIKEESVSTKIMLEGESFYVGLVIDPSGFSLRLKVPDEILKTFLRVAGGIRAGDPRALLEMSKIPRSVETLDPLFLPAERSCIHQYMKVSYAALTTNKLFNEIITLIEVLAHDTLEKDITSWLREEAKQLNIRSLEPSSLTFRNFKELSWLSAGCKVSSLYPFLIALASEIPKTVVLEYPELCLHPKEIVAVAKLVSIYLNVLGKRIIVSSNSDYFLSEINNLTLMFIRGNYIDLYEKTIALDPDKVSVYRVSWDRDETAVEKIPFERGFNENEFLEVLEDIYRRRTQLLRDMELGRKI